MNVEQVLFYLFALGAIAGCSGVVLSRNPINSAVSLVAAFFFLAGNYVLLHANFMAIVQILVYAGAIMVLFLFVLMLLNQRDEELGRVRGDHALDEPRARAARSTCFGRAAPAGSSTSATTEASRCSTTSPDSSRRSCSATATMPAACGATPNSSGSRSCTPRRSSR
jgi:uncharacterized MnhB-related membrane protein